MFTYVFRRIPLFILAICMATTTLLGCYTAPVSAAIKTVQDMTIGDESAAMGYYYALRVCVRDAFTYNSDISDYGLSNDYFFTEHAVIQGGQFITTDGNWDGVNNCSRNADKTAGDGPGWVDDGLTALGYSSQRDFVCQLVNSLNNNATDTTAYQNCLNGQGNVSLNNFGNLTAQQREDAYSNSVGKRVFGNTEPLNRVEGNAVMQNILYNTFVKRCQPVDYTGGTIGTDLTKFTIKKYNSGSYTNQDVLVKTSILSDHTGIIEANPDGLGRDLKCSDMPSAINQFADLAGPTLKNIPNSAKFFGDAGTTIDAKGGSGDPVKSGCAIDGIGWIVCPVVKFLGSVADSAYGIIGQLLTVQPLSTDTSAHNGVYTAWAAVRNIANVVFVIAFLIIIYSQISGMGVSNYGIKKLLPKLIVAAILVNASYWICAIAVDLSNIAGTSVTSFLKSVTDSMPAPQGDPASQFWNGADGSSGVIALVLAGGVALYLGLTILLPVLIAVIAAALSALIVLMLRQALIVILIFISPLAFVALLLPNTEDLFKRWRQLFTTMLLMFPIVAVVFSGSALASRVLNISANSADASKGDFNLWLMQITAAGVAVIPLFIVPVLMKAAGGLLHRFAGVVNNPNKGMFDRMRKGASNLRESRQTLRDARSLNRNGLGKALDVRGYGVRRRARNDAVLKARQREVQLGSADYIANAVDSGKGPAAALLRHDLAGGGGAAGAQRALANAINTKIKLEADEVTAASAIIKDLDQNALRALATGGQHENLDGSKSLSLRTAAMKKVIDTQDITGINSLADQAASGAMNEETRQAFADVLEGSSGRPAYYSMGAIAQIRQGKGPLGAPLKNSTQFAADAVSNNTYSADKMVTTSKDELEYIAGIAADPTIATNNTQIVQAAQTVQTHSQYAGKASKQAGIVDDIARL